MSRTCVIALASVSLFVALYFGTAATILRYGLDDFLWPRVSGPDPLPGPTYAASGDGSGVIVRAVGPDTGRCVVFFPGHSGGFNRYSRDLFPGLNSIGFQVWAIAYPGQDGARGKATRALVLAQVESLLESIGRRCRKAGTVFLGRSLGASVAAIAAARWRPDGLVLEGAGLSLAAAVRHVLAHRWYSRALKVLPIDSLVAPEFPLLVWVARFGPSRTIIFQGQMDEVAPPEDLAPLARVGVTVHVVPGATHTNAYLLAGRSFYEAIATLGGNRIVATARRQERPIRPAPRRVLMASSQPSQSVTAAGIVTRKCGGVNTAATRPQPSTVSR